MPPVAQPPAQEAAKVSEHHALMTEIWESPESEREMAEQQVARAIELEGRKEAINQEVTANRNFLRLMVKSKAITDEAIIDFVEDFYPLKEKDSQRSKDEVQRTRLAKESARKLAKS